MRPLGLAVVLSFLASGTVFCKPTIINISSVLETAKTGKDGGKFQIYHRPGYGIRLSKRLSTGIRSVYVSRGETLYYLVSGNLFVNQGGLRRKISANTFLLVREGDGVPPMGLVSSEPAILFSIESPDYWGEQHQPPTNQPSQEKIVKDLSRVWAHHKSENRKDHKRLFFGAHMDSVYLRVNKSKKIPPNKYGEYVLYFVAGELTLNADGASVKTGRGELAVIPKDTDVSIDNSGVEPVMVLLVGLHPPAEDRRDERSAERMDRKGEHHLQRSQR